MISKASRPSPVSLLCSRCCICRTQIQGRFSKYRHKTPIDCDIQALDADKKKPHIFGHSPNNLALSAAFWKSKYWLNISSLLYLLLSRDPSTIKLSSRKPRISAVSPPFSMSSPLSLNVIRLRTWLRHSSFTCTSLASMSFSFTADMQMSFVRKKKYIYIKYKSTALSLGAVGHYLKPLQTSISSLWSSSGASMMFCSVKVSDSTSNVCLVSFAIWSQCRLNIDLLAIISSKPHDSLKSSIVFFRSRKACHSLSPFGNFRHLENRMHCLNLWKYESVWIYCPTLSTLLIILNWR